jgi:geranylgeranyl diphosphate synthase type II
MLNYKKQKKIVDNYIKKFISTSDIQPLKLKKVINYALFPGGKRLRPILCLYTGKIFTNNTKKILPGACALELIHTYSLIHDDLPCLDNDDYRRNKLSVHKKFGEDFALLAGDALQSLAFQLLSQYTRDMSVINTFSDFIGPKGMVAGQALELTANKKRITRKTILTIHYLKTANLITASIITAAILCKADKAGLKKLELFGKNLGLAFQLTDDILDITKEKTNSNSLNYAARFGIEEAKSLTMSFITKAKRNLEPFGKKAESLRNITAKVLKRIT